MKRALWAIPIAAVLVGLLGYGFGRDPGAIPAPLVGHRAPEFTLASIDGGHIRLAALRGHPVVLNFWASWCVACHQEQPYLTAAYHHWRRSVRFVGVVFEDSSAAARAYLHANHDRWPSAADPGRAVAINYGISGVPETFFINRRGVIVAKATGPIMPGSPFTPADLNRELQNLVRGVRS